MRTFLDVLRFELRMQCGSRLFQGLLFLFFAVHLLTAAQTGITSSLWRRLSRALPSRR